MENQLRVWRVFRPGPIHYDEYDSKVVLAFTPEEARRLASLHVGDEGSSVWLDSQHSLCLEEELTDGRERVIGESFNAG